MNETFKYIKDVSKNLRKSKKTITSGELARMLNDAGYTTAKGKKFSESSTRGLFKGYLVPLHQEIMEKSSKKNADRTMSVFTYATGKSII